MVPVLEPMLCDRGLPPGGLEGWAAEPKLDGWRVLVTVDEALPGGVAVRTRRGKAVTVPVVDALAGVDHRVVLDGELLVDRPYRERRAILEQLSIPAPCGIVPRYSGDDAAALLEACATHDVEGVVLKRLRSVYRSGERSRHWRKVKSPGWAAEHAQRRHA